MPTEQDAKFEFLPIPEDFPVVWEEPEDKYRFWELDPHYTKPRKTLDFELLKIICNMFSSVSNIYGYPFKSGVRLFNTCVYGTWYPDFDPDISADTIVERYMEKMNPVLTNFMGVWENEWLPELKEHFAYWESYDLKGASMKELLAHLDETIRRQELCFKIRATIFFTELIGRSLFDDMYHEIFKDAGPFDACGLLLGYGANMKYHRDAWELSRQALASPVLHKALTENEPEDVFNTLSDSEEGRSYKEKLVIFLQDYGKRGERMTLEMPSQNPVPLINTLKNHIKEPDDHFDTLLKKWEDQRDQRLAKVREQLKSYPEPVVEKFESLLKIGEGAYKIREEHNQLLDLPKMRYFRSVVSEFSRRLTEAGVIKNKDDIYHLSFDEVKEAAGTLPKVIDFSSHVNERKLMEEQFADYTPPMFLGGFSTDFVTPDDPMTRAYLKIEAPELKLDVPDGQLGGTPASPGKVRGTAKVVRNLYEIQKLEPGDIIVVESAPPSWTPIFGNIAGMITDIGGILSHSAILAREYGIPCVASIRMATSIIKDGQLIEVDGDKGIVKFLDQE